MSMTIDGVEYPSYSSSEFEKLYLIYMGRFPDADDPLDYVIGLGNRVLYNIMIEAGDRKIIFKDFENTKTEQYLDGVNYSFE